MTADRFTYRQAAEAPNLTLPWLTETAANTFTNLDLSSGFTFTVVLRNTAGTDVVTKTTGITGADGSVSIVWAADELDIAVGEYDLLLRARETATSKDRDYRPGDPVRVVIVE